MTTYGYIGLGMMGSAMVERLVGTGADVIVFDLDGAAVARAVEQGAQAAADATAVAEHADIISICVPAAPHVDAVLDGIERAPAHDFAMLLHSTVHPDTVRAAHERAGTWGVALFDACVAGGDENARAGTLTILAGGADDMTAEVRAVLDVYGTKVINGGAVGTGAALKLAVNVMTYAQFAAAATAHDLVVGQAGEPAALLDAWRHTGQLGALTERYSAMLGIPVEHITGDLRTMLETQVGIGQKDLDLARSLGGTRAGARALLDALHDAMPAVYGVDQ